MTINLVNGRGYIGRDSKKRKGYLGSGVFLKQAIAKHGRDNFVRINLEMCRTMKELINREKFWIEYYDAVKSNVFYNMSEGTGGFGPNDRHTEETKHLISQKCRGRKLTSEQRNSRIKNLTGREPWNKGKKLDPDSDEYKRAYLNRKPLVYANHALMKCIVDDYDTGEYTFAELSLKYDRQIKSIQIRKYREKLNNASTSRGP